MTRVSLNPFKVEVFEPNAGSDAKPMAALNQRGGFVFETTPEARESEGDEGSWSESPPDTCTRENADRWASLSMSRSPPPAMCTGSRSAGDGDSLKPTQAYETPSSGWFGGSSNVDRAQQLGEPYRLYNLDVFEYLDESLPGLYGSIPIATAHGVSNGVPLRHRACISTTRARCTWTSTSTARTACTLSGWPRAARWMCSSPGATDRKRCVSTPLIGHDVDAADVRPGLPPVPMELPRRKRRQGSG